MNLWPFRKPNPGRDLALIGKAQRRALYKATHDEMAARVGLPPIPWSPSRG